MLKISVLQNAPGVSKANSNQIHGWVKGISYIDRLSHEEHNFPALENMNT